MRNTLVYLLAAGVGLTSTQAWAQQYGTTTDDSAAGQATQQQAETPPATETIVAKPTGDGVAEAPANSTPQIAADAGWNADWALLFVINNVLVTSTILSEYRGLGIAGVYYLGPDAALRVGVEVSRDHNPPFVTKNTNEVAGQSVTTYNWSVGGNTSNGSVNASADYLMRMMRTAIAPYWGAGAQVSVSHSRLTYDDDVSIIDQITHVRNRSSSLSLSARGLLGAEWRFHPNFAIFAEYEALLSLMSYSSFANERRIESTSGGTRSVNKERSEGKSTAFLELNNFLTQGASFGLTVLFD
jgi:hypothetical protein